MNLSYIFYQLIYSPFKHLKIMKKVLFVSFALCSLLLSSCTSDVNENVVDPITSDVTISKQSAYEEFLYALDSINSLDEYQKGRTRSLETYVAVRIADGIGSAIGNKVGTNVGAALGSMSGNPLIAIIGYLAGRKYGAKIVGSVFSAAVGIFGDVQVTPLNPNDGVVIPIDSANICYFDSIGLGHNMAMGYFHNNKQSYVNILGTTDMEQLYDDCVDMLVVEEIIKDSFYNATSIKNQIIYLADLTAKNVRNYLSGRFSYSAFLELEKDMLINNVNMDALEAKFYIDLCDDIVDATSDLTSDEIKTYGVSLKSLIDSSNFDTETKENVYSTVNILLSSVICWQEDVGE